MSSEEQIKANRLNAQKSTGPKTAEGKAIVAQNAIKHGLFAAKNVINCEKQHDFDQFRAELLTNLAPVGGVESMMAERIVSLSWRLKRVERMNSEVIDVMIAIVETDPWHKELREDAGLLDPKTGRSELVLGWVTNRDFTKSNVLDQLLMYEKRIESSLYKAMSELQKLQRMRKREQVEAIEPEPAQSSPSLRDEAATRFEGERLHCEKQSQFPPAKIDVKSYDEKNCKNTSHFGLRENKSERSQFKPMSNPHVSSKSLSATLG